VATPERPAAEGIPPGHFPAAAVRANHTAPAPRRIRGMIDGAWLFDTTRALYVWEHPHYPQYHLPHADVVTDRLVADGTSLTDERGRFACYAIHTCEGIRHRAARKVVEPAIAGIAGTWRFDWNAVDHWFEEDEEVFVHPRNPYVRVDALPSTRPVRVMLGRTVVAASSWSVHVFETGLPSRCYLPRTTVDWAVLSPSDTTSQCPYKGLANRYWHAHVGDATLRDVAWSYDFPTRQVQPIAGLVAFSDDQDDVTVEIAPSQL
jgi:uncharacterized protein (DUF427 family)